MAAVFGWDEFDGRRGIDEIPAAFSQRISISRELSQSPLGLQSVRVLAILVNRVLKNSLVSPSTRERPA